MPAALAEGSMPSRLGLLSKPFETGCHAEHKIDFVRVVDMDAGVSNIAFPVFWEDRFQLCFEEHPFSIDLLTVKHPFVKFAFTVCIVERQGVCMGRPIVRFARMYKPFHIAGSLPVKDQAASLPF